MTQAMNDFLELRLRGASGTVKVRLLGVQAIRGGRWMPIKARCHLVMRPLCGEFQGTTSSENVLHALLWCSGSPQGKSSDKLTLDCPARDLPAGLSTHINENHGLIVRNQLVCIN